MKSRILAYAIVLLMVGIGAAPAANAAPNPLASSYVVTMATPAATMSLGNSMKVTGTVRGAGATRVTLYQLSRTRWVAWGSARLIAGRYTVYYKPVTAGGHVIRVITPTTRMHRAGASVGRIITVYTWHYLSDFANTTRVTASYWDTQNGVANINGGTYVHTPYDVHAQRGETGYVEYNLSRACLTFQMTAGLTDESGSGGSAQLEVLTDGVQNWARTLTLGQAQAVSLSVRGNLRLRLDDTIVMQTPDQLLNMTPAFGNARVLCRF